MKFFDQLMRGAKGQAALNDLYACIGFDAADYIQACADLAKLGMSADDLRRIEHAAINARILSFGWGDIRDIGETTGPHGRTRGTASFEGEQ